MVTVSADSANQAAADSAGDISAVTRLKSPSSPSRLSNPNPTNSQCANLPVEPDQDSIRELRRRAIRLLARREYSAHEIRNRMAACLLDPPGAVPKRSRKSENSSVSCESRNLHKARNPDNPDNPDTGRTIGVDADINPDTNLAADDLNVDAALFEPVAPRQPTAAELDTVIAQMQALDLQSDQRFAESLVRRRGEREGVARVAGLLKQHQIDEAICHALLVPLRASEFERAYEVWLRRFGALPESLKEKARQARFLGSRGFPSDVISRILRGAVP